MEKMKQWCITVCAVSVVPGVLMCLVPKGSSKSTYKVLVSIILLYTMIFPFYSLKKSDFDFSKIIPQNNTSVTDAHEGELYIAQKTYERYIESQLTEISGETGCECICTYAEGELILEKIIIITEVTDEQKQAILQKLKSVGNENTTVLFRGDENERNKNDNR